MAKTLKLENGKAEVIEIIGEDEKGNPTFNKWTGGVDQIARHTDTFQNADQKLRAGDLSALKDAQRDHLREMKKRG